MGNGYERVPIMWGWEPHRREAGGLPPYPLEVHVRASGTAGWGWTTLKGRYHWKNETTEGFTRIGLCLTVGWVG